MLYQTYHSSAILYQIRFRSIMLQQFVYFIFEDDLSRTRDNVIPRFRDYGARIFGMMGHLGVETPYPGPNASTDPKL